MSKIYDVTRPGSSAPEKIRHLIAQFRQRSEQRHRIEIALYCGAIANVRPNLIYVDAPIDADHIAAGGV